MEILGQIIKKKQVLKWIQFGKIPQNFGLLNLKGFELNCSRKNSQLLGF